MRSMVIVMALVSFVMCNVGVAADSASGIVMEHRGQTATDWSRMKEIPPNTDVLVGPKEELTFLHYRSCKLVTVGAGTLKLTDTDYSFDGRVLSEKPGPCPQIHPLSSTGTAAALLTRGVEMTIPVNAQIIFVGDKVSGITGAAIYAANRPGQPIMRLKYTDHRATIPKDELPLLPNTRYLLRLTFMSNPQTTDLSFIGAAQTKDESVVILRID